MFAIFFGLVEEGVVVESERANKVLLGVGKIHFDGVLDLIEKVGWKCLRVFEENKKLCRIN